VAGSDNASKFPGSVQPIHGWAGELVEERESPTDV